MQINQPSKTTTLADIFLDALEQTATPDLKQWIERVRMIMHLPDCVEVFSTIITNAVGGRIPIKEGTIHKGIDCLIKYNTIEIELTNLSSQDKEIQIALMTSWEKYCEQLIITAFYQQGLLIR